MAKFTVEQGKRYWCKIELGFIEAFAGNDEIARRLTEAGFTEVDVTGDGSTREAEGLWPGATVTAELPSQIVEVEEMEA